MSHRTRALALLSLVLASCVAPLDMLGMEEIVTQTERLSPPDDITDDRIEDKHPVFDGTMDIVETFSGCAVTLNKSGAVTKLDIVPFTDSDGDVDGRLFPTWAAAVSGAGSRELMASMDVVNAALKPFNDGLYAAVELGAEDASDGSPVDKRAVLGDLLATLVARSGSGTAAEQPLAREAAVTVAAALSLGGGAPQATASILADASSLAAKFTANDAYESRPIGFYSWSPALSGIFTQDRLLQSPAGFAPSFGAFAATAVALNATPGLAARYQGVLDLYAGLTNPYFQRPVADLLALAPDASALSNVAALESAFASAHPETTLAPETCASHLAFLPASESAETRLFRTLYCADAPPAGTNLIDVLIAKIRSGKIDLTPTATSGWYDRQTYALETLLVPDKAPEKDHLFLTKRYKEKLVETFKALITENRETHVKQLDRSMTGGDSASISIPPTPVDVYPLLPVEPFPTFYLRTARAYAFLGTFLRAAMGDAFLAKTSRVLDGGTRGAAALGDELTDTTTLMYGLHLVAAKSIGMAHQMTAEEMGPFVPATCEARARAWLAGWAKDAGVAADPRVIVPIHADAETDTVRYWVVVGVKMLHAEASFYPGFGPVIRGVAGNCVYRSLVARAPYELMAQMVEVSIRRTAPPPTRAELRALCDQAGSVEAIVAALEAL